MTRWQKQQADTTSSRGGSGRTEKEGGERTEEAPSRSSWRSGDKRLAVAWVLHPSVHHARCAVTESGGVGFLVIAVVAEFNRHMTHAVAVHSVRLLLTNQW